MHGFRLPDVEADYSAKAPGLARVEREMSGPGCGRCGLRGPHECVTINDYLEARTGAGRIEPSTDVDEREPRRKPDGTEKIYAASSRTGIALDALRGLLAQAGINPPKAKSGWRVKRSVIDRVVREALARGAA